MTVLSSASPAEASLSAAPADAPLRTSYFVPAVETLGVQFGLLAFNKLTNAPFAQLSWDSIRSHFDGRAPWTYDVDLFITNQLGHPYQGSLGFTAARSSGVGFWEASLYTFMGSLAWEYFFETEAPSINDQITTAIGGVLLGEALFRTYRIVMEDSGGPPGFVRSLAGALISPASALNYWLFDDRFRLVDIDDRPPFFASVNPGVSLSARYFERSGNSRTLLIDQGPQAFISAELTYGSPGDPQWRYRYPFSYFNLSFGLTFPGVSTANLYIHGLLAGSQFGREQRGTRGIWGLFGLYDYGANNIARVSSVGVGPGTSLQLPLGEKSFLRGTFILAALGFAAAGVLEVDAAEARDYHIGPGLEVAMDARWVLRDRGLVGLKVNHWSISGFYVEPKNGFESITYVTADARLRVARHVAIGLELPVWVRLFGVRRSDRSAIAGSGPRLTVSLMSDDFFGTSGP